MDALDGNAIGGLLIDVFGTEMTTARSTCATCGASRPVAELVVYRQAPGAVVRCRTCGSVLMVFVRAHGAIGTDLTGLASLSQPDRPLSPGKQKGKANMSHEESMSMGQPDEDAMAMGQPDEDAMAMGQPDEDAMAMGQPDEGTMAMGQPDQGSM
jgi:hypothetical protein